ncbi:MAG: hypothetical protein HKP21_13880 [Xanthomonadales bacterium]|jgi:hypothetical protein|nr:hypothetical protein [Gammaproteobacteria bacterium]MBT8074784.1 hypothetical protein [Gammaproteobacteria bacterium]MBT8076163.1 hypothetical protein [Gammaproteobacteria bacterium]NNK05636.1 hypothetical protein [Xanthomonadales bacterium]NNK97626.1 hypothetical protein [Xanthomonadales bacterium]
MTHEEKLELVNFLIFLRGKLQSLAIRLILLGEDPKKVDEAEKRLAKEIKKLRINMMLDWQGDAAELMAKLRQSNEQAQRHVRELKDAQQRTAKLANILGLIDRGMESVAGLLV